MHRLTPRQILVKDEITADKEALEATLQIALKHHENQYNLLHKKECLWWDDLGDTFGVDVKDGSYMVKHKDATVVLIKTSEEDD